MGKVIYKSFKGNITAKDFQLKWEYILNKKIISPDTKGLILDCSQAIFQIDADDILEITKIFRDNLNVFQNLKIAYITKLPEQTVFSILIQEHDFMYETKPFSSEEAALDWIQ